MSTLTKTCPNCKVSKLVSDFYQRNDDTSCGACVRGLTCSACNQAIGLLADDPIRAARAADYLRGAGLSRR